MTTFADLAIKIDSTGGEKAKRDLDNLTASSVKAEGTVERLGDAAQETSGDLRVMAAAANDADASLARGLVNQKGLTQVVTAHTRATKLQSHELKNLAFQANDVAVSLASGMNPMMVLMQQGSQVGQILGTSGVGLGAVLKQLGGIFLGTVGKFAVPLGIAAVAAGGLSLGLRAINQDAGDLTKGLGLTEKQLAKVSNTGVTMGDMLKATFQVTGQYLVDAIGAERLKGIQDGFTKAMDGIADAAKWAAGAFVGGWIGSYKAVTTAWATLPRVLGDIAFTAANVTIAAVEIMVNRIIDRINMLTGFANAAAEKVFGGPVFGQLGSVSLGRIDNPFAGAAREGGAATGKAMADGWADGFRIVDKLFSDIAAQSIKNAKARILKEAGEAKATVAKAAKEVAKAANDNFKLLDPESFQLDLKLDNIAFDLTRLEDPLKGFKSVTIDTRQTAEEQFLAIADAADRIRSSLDGVKYSLKNGDWMDAARGLLGAFKSIQQAFRDNGIAGGIGATASAAGSVIGGKAGSILGGVGTGISIGASLGGPPGAVIGAVVGGIAGLFGASKAAKRAAEEARKAATEQAAAQIEATRQRLADIEAHGRQLEIRTIELTKGSLAALTETRKDELAATADANKAAQEYVYRLEDLTAAVEVAKQAEADAQSKVDEARSKLTDAYEREKSALTATRDKFKALADSLAGFRASLGQQYGGGAAIEAQFKSIAAAAAGGDPEALGKLQGVSEQYLAVSKASAKTELDYLRKLAEVSTAVRLGQKAAEQQVSTADAQLAALEQQVAGLGIINNSVLTVGQAVVDLKSELANLAAAQSAVASATAALAGAKGPAAGGGATNPDYAAYVASYGDLSSYYSANASSLAKVGYGSLESFGQYHWNTNGQYENRTLPKYANGGEFTVGGSGGTDSQKVEFLASPWERVKIENPRQAGNDNAAMTSAIRSFDNRLRSIESSARTMADAIRAAAYGENPLYITDQAG